MPTPRKREKESEFVSRYVSSPEAQATFPEKSKRLAVAYSKYNHRKQVSAVKKIMKGK